LRCDLPAFDHSLLDISIGCYAQLDTLHIHVGAADSLASTLRRLLFQAHLPALLHLTINIILPRANLHEDIRHLFPFGILPDDSNVPSVTSESLILSPEIAERIKSFILTFSGRFKVVIHHASAFFDLFGVARRNGVRSVQHAHGYKVMEVDGAWIGDTITL
jgi:hypothetical protein